MRAAVLTEINRPLQILDLEQELPEPERFAYRSRQPACAERLAHHERRLAAPAADGSRP